MATRIIRLAQALELFRLRLGDMVAARDSEGDADLEYTGTVVDGTQEENPDTGAYEIVYRVKRADDAKDLNLIRLYDGATLREEIRHRLATYRLHRSLHPHQKEISKGTKQSVKATAANGVRRAIT
jgi:hypothetical protein